MPIDWKYPPPRSGLVGAWDRFVGPGATQAESMLQVVTPIIAAVAAPLYASRVVEGWSVLQYVVCSVLAFDTAGGVITNATSSAKRWYHRSGQGFKQHIGLVSLHLIHLLLFSWVYLALDFEWILVAGGYLMLASTVVLWVPQYLQRPTAFLGFACGLLIALYLLPQPAGVEWFLPLFYLKVLVTHLVKEEPYRPVE